MNSQKTGTATNTSLLLANAARRVVGTRPVEELGRDLCEEVRSTLQVDVCIVRVLRKGELALFCSSGIPFPLPHSIPITCGIARRLIEDRASLSLQKDDPGSSELARFEDESALSAYPMDFRSYCGAPLVVGDRVLGVLGVYTLHKKREFTEPEMEQVELVASHIGVALANQQLYLELQESTERLRVALDDQARLQRLLSRKVLHDSLTDLPNRALFLEFGRERIARRGPAQEPSLGVVIIDYDRFRSLNAGLGHLMGDSVLRVAADRLRWLAGKHSAVVARTGGDEFGVLLEDMEDEAELEAVCRKLIIDMSGRIELEGHAIYPSWTAGAALARSGGESVEELLEKAEIALHCAKPRPSDVIKVFQSGMASSVLPGLQLESDLYDAVENEEIEVWYQPIADSNTLCVTGFEALARWNHPARGILAAAEFIPVAEKCGLVVRLGELVLSSVLNTMREWNKAVEFDRDFFVSINVSSTQFEASGFDHFLISSVRNSGVPRRNLCLEITESVAMADPEHTAEVMRTFTSSGIRIFLDDFGVGQSSLAQVYDIPVAGLKIDKSFIKAVEVGGAKRDVVKVVRQISDTLGSIVVAEGIETDSQVEYCRQQGCHLLQGHLLGLPMRETEARELYIGRKKRTAALSS